jgi:predicted aldo/keto reductase-like oxidoreductase
MKNRDRKSVFITTKLNLTFWKDTREGIKDRFQKCLERLQMDYVDCLMIHMASTKDQVKHEAYHEVVKELRADGKVRFTGLSNHGPEHKLAGKLEEPMEKVFLAAVEDGRFDVTLFVHNFIQKNQGEKIIKACKSKNMGTTLMKTDPVKFYSDIENMFAEAEEKGRKIPEATQKMMEEYRSHIARAEEFKSKYNLTNNAQVHEAAIKFCLDNPDVHAVCPTINSFEQLEAHLILSGQKLDPVETALLSDYENAHGQFYCRHACGLCESSCPAGVPVNTIMRYDHYFRAQGREKTALEKYAALPPSKADKCVNCKGYCENACPYGIPIQGLLTLAHQTLTIV